MGQRQYCSPGAGGPGPPWDLPSRSTLGTQGLQTCSRVTRALARCLPLEKGIAEGLYPLAQVLFLDIE